MSQRIQCSIPFPRTWSPSIDWRRTQRRTESPTDVSSSPVSRILERVAAQRRGEKFERAPHVAASLLGRRRIAIAPRGASRSCHHLDILGRPDRDHGARRPADDGLLEQAIPTLRLLSRILFASRSSPPADYGDTRRGDDDELLPTPSPATEDEVLARLTAAFPLVAEAPRRCGKNGRPPRRLERRAYNPTSHGTGMYYNWKIERVDHSLFSGSLSQYRKQGWRVASLSPAAGEILSAWDVLWVVDDDSNFLWGVEICGVGSLGDLVAELFAANRRVLHVSPAVDAPDVEDAAVVVTWIADGKYAFDPGDDDIPGDSDAPLWGIWVFDTQTGDKLFHAGHATRAGVEMDDLVGRGYRPIWSTCFAPVLVLVMVNDGFRVGWYHVLEAGVDKSYDPADLLADPNAAGLVPHCIDCHAIPVIGPDDPSIFWWSALFLEDPDLDPAIAPESNWTLQIEPSLPDANLQRGLIANGRRVIAFTTRRLKANGTPFDGKSRDVARIECTKYAPEFRAISTCEDAEVVDPIIGAPIVNLVIDLLVYMSMSSQKITSFALAIRMPAGWQIRRGYTLAPRCYPNVYPESQFRIASVSKIITATTLLRSLVDAGYKASEYGNLRLFRDVLTDVVPSLGPTAYPESVLDVTFEQIFTHTTPWAQNPDYGGFDPGASPRALTLAVGASETPIGYLADDGRTCLPLTRDVYYFYMLNEIAFGQNPVWDDVDAENPTEASVALGNSVGWIGAVADIALQSNYSGWAVDLTAQAIERLGAVEGLDVERGQDYAGYLQRVRALVLAPLEMTSTSAGVSRRRSPNRDEVVFVGGPYLEVMEPQVLPTPFSKTVLFEASTSGVPASYYAGSAPVDATAAPAYATGPYGGAGRIRLEPVVPAGGWVSTAVDLARFSGCLELGNPILPDDWVLDISRTLQPTNTFTRGGWGRLSNATGDVTFQFFGSLTYSGATPLYNRNRRLHVSGVGSPAAGTNTIVVDVDNLLSSLGIVG